MKRPAHITHVNGVETSAISISDRGLAYGDGLFETMRVAQGQIPLLAKHLERFLKGVDVLGLGRRDTLKREFLKYLNRALDEIKTNACLERSVIKVMVTRGVGGRGYVPPIDPKCQFIIQVFDQPDYPDSYYQQGIVLKTCEYRLGYQPQLAGIKHLNRLDQVLASQELLDEAEGLLLDYEGNVIEGTKSNLLVFSKGKISTPRLDGSGVQGVLRNALLDSAPELAEKKLFLEEKVIPFNELEHCDGLAMINSVFGLWPVKTLNCIDGREIHFKLQPQCKTLQQYLTEQYIF